MPLRHDPNGLWHLETALRYASELDFLEYWEDPVRGQEAMAELGRQIALPLATNMCTTSFDDLPSSNYLRSEDIILCDHHFWGGLRDSIDLARICRVIGRELSMHSNSHLGISMAAMVHLGAALPRLTYALDTHYPWQSEEVIAGGRWQFDQGCVEVPDRPGLGVEIDDQALAALHQNFLDCGLSERNDEVEMQRVVAGWQFQATRW